MTTPQPPVPPPERTSAARAPSAPAAPLAPAPAEPPDAAPRYFAWTDRWDPGTWETPDNPTRLQKLLAGVALVIVVIMTIWLPLRILKIL